EQGLLMESYPGPFGQMLTHLVRNAVTHAFPERLSGAVDIRMAASGLDHVEVSVVDNGCGMTPDIRRMAFDPFFTTRRNHGAAGLGLHIVIRSSRNGWAAGSFSKANPVAGHPFRSFCHASRR